MKAAREAGRLSLVELKNFPKAVQFFRQVVLDSGDPSERLGAQKQLATLYSEQMGENEKAITEINRLLPLLSDKKDLETFRMFLIRAYHYQNNFSQALLESDILLKLEPSPEIQFDVIVLRGNIFLAQKNLPSAVTEFRKALKVDIERSIKENVPITLAVALEEMHDYDAAIRVLEENTPKYKDPDYIRIRIQRLIERKKVQPGARGLRK